MPSILVIVFVLQLVIHLVNTLGAATVNNVLWALYMRIPTATSKAAADHIKLQREFLKLRKDLNGTSSQDEFAKWAKIRRQHDKVLEQLEKSKTSANATRAKFDSTVNILRWLSTNGLRALLQFWYSKQPMFWLPGGSSKLPYYAEWLLSFPRAPLGSISIQAWQLACGSFILVVSDALTAVLGLVLASKSNAGNRSGEKMKVPASSSAEKGSQKAAGKEL